MKATTNQIVTLAINLQAHSNIEVIGATNEQIIKAVDTVVDLYADGVHDVWDDESALFTAQDVLDDIMQTDALEAMVPERERDYIRV